MPDVNYAPLNRRWEFPVPKPQVEGALKKRRSEYEKVVADAQKESDKAKAALDALNKKNADAIARSPEAPMEDTWPLQSMIRRAEWRQQEYENGIQRVDILLNLLGTLPADAPVAVTADDAAALGIGTKTAA